jgi:hypothetical protein
MAKVFGIHEITLQSGVTPDQFEQAIAAALSQWPQFEGFKISVAKGDRGVRSGKYIFVYEIESVEARNRYFPAPGMLSEEAQRASERAAPVFEKLSALCSSSFTDYVVFAM